MANDEDGVCTSRMDGPGCAMVSVQQYSRVVEGAQRGEIPSPKMPSVSYKCSRRKS